MPSKHRTAKLTLLIVSAMLVSITCAASPQFVLQSTAIVVQNTVGWVYTSQDPLVFEFNDNGNDSYDNPGSSSGSLLPYTTYASAPHEGVRINWGRNDPSWTHTFSSAGTGSLSLQSNGNSGGRTLAFCNSNASGNQFTVSGLDWAKGIILEVKEKSVGDLQSSQWPSGYSWGGNYSVGGIEYNFFNLGGNPAGAPSGSSDTGMVLSWRTNNPTTTSDDYVSIHLMGGPTELAGASYSLGGSSGSAPEHEYKMTVRRSPLPWQQQNDVVLVNVYVDGTPVIVNKTVSNYADTWGDGFVLGSRQINRSPRGDTYDWVKLHEADALPADTDAPSRPTGVAVESTAPGVTITWNSSTDATSEVIGYRIKRNGVYVGYTDSTSYSDTGGSTSSTYHILAVDSVGNESAADTQAPSVPSNVQASILSSTSVLVSWTASTDDVGLAGYRIFRNGIEVGIASTNSYIDESLEPGESYSYTVAAYDWAGNVSAQSSPPAVATTPNVSGYCSIDMGTTDVPDLLTRVDYAEGYTTAVTIGGLNCRQPADSGDSYFYFDIDDGYIYNGNMPTVYLEVCYYDEAGSITPHYDSIDDEYTAAEAVTLGGTNKWRTATWTLTDCLFANRQNGGADFRLDVGADSVKIDSVRVSTIPYSSHLDVERNLGSAEVYRGLSHPQNEDGDTTVVTMGGKECRKPVAEDDYYFYFNVSDAFVYDGSTSTLYLKVDYYDSANGRIQPQYDSTSGIYTNASTIYTSGTNLWKQASWTLNNVKFANRQSVSADFRLYVGTLQNVHVARVVISKVPFGPAAPVVTYPFGEVDTFTPTITWIGEPHDKYRVLVQAEGSPAHGWDSGEVTSIQSTTTSGTLLPNRTYKARVKLANANGWGDYSEPAEFTTPSSPCVQITFPADVMALNDARPTLKWTVSSAQSLTFQSIQIDSGTPVSLSTGVRSYQTSTLATGYHNATVSVIETGGATSETTVRFWINATPADTGTLYVYDVSFLKSYSSSNLAQRRLFYDTCHFLGTLQGIVNRNGPRLYLTNFFSQDQTWLNILRDADNGWLRSKTVVNLSGTAGISTLISVFGDEIKGVVEYDPNVWSTSNVASTIAGVEDLVAIRKDTASGSFYYQYVLNGPQLPVVKSLVGMFTGTGMIPGTARPSTGSRKCDAYIWAKINYLDSGKCSPLTLAYWLDSYWLQKPYGISTPEHLLFNHDYVVAKRGFLFDLSPWGDETPVDDPNQPLGTDLATMKEILLSAYTTSGGKMIHVSGFSAWWIKYTTRSGGAHGDVATEWEWAKVASSYNAFMDADATSYSDMLNASIFTNFPLPDRLIQNPKPSPQEMRRLGYLDPAGVVAPYNFIYFYIGDYDSAAWIYRRTPGFWTDSARGQTAMGWAFNPNLIQRHAVAFDYYYRTKSDLDFFIAGDSGAGYINPPNLFPTRNPSGLPSGAAAWAAHCEPFYRQMDYSITGFLINGYCGALNPTMELVYRPFSGDGIMTQPAWMHADSHLEQNMPVAKQLGDLSGSTQEMANIVHQNGVYGSTNFISYRTILKSPSNIKGVVDTLRSQNPSMNYHSVDPHIYFYLLRQSLGGNNERRATYTFDTFPKWGCTGDVITAHIGVRNDGWETWYSGGSNRTVLAVNISPTGGRTGAVTVPLPRDIQPGEGEVLTVQIIVPAGGLHKLMYQMRTGDTGWFEDAGDLPWRADFSAYYLDDIAAIRSAPDGTLIMLTGMPVTAGTLQFKSRAYVETTDRTWGVRINTDEVLDIGDVITVRGEIHTSQAGERYIVPHAISR